MTGKTIAQVEAEWVAHGNVARLEAKIASEPNEAARKGFEKMLAEQRKLMVQK